MDVCLVKSQQRRGLIESERFLRDFPPSSRYLIGVSGGRDSIALLNLMVDLGYKKLVVCHLNHQLRGASSRDDARFVEKVARNLRLDCIFRRGRASPALLPNVSRPSCRRSG
ncbi:MAG: hypothetical protein DMF23_05340 [Verrucomicrobia bacterium]|nr:MAG: hypothetical protein DMF23_05340 [Verrucomicrobiota bacterium]